jgi:hypothetical protein
MGESTKPRAGTIAMAAFGVVALLLYGWFLSVNAMSVSGDAVVGQAIEALTALGLLWLVLLVLMGFDRGIGGPSWPRRAGWLVAPVTAIATVFATDYPHNPLCQWGIILAPLLIGLYMLAGRLPARQAGRAQAVILLPMAAFSAYSINLFAG